ncbi:S24 family peptidase [Tepidicaulis sp. LMO-SS28]|uniref:S24 family peptidase n=1 Tax=Tepidicaulis sp. LMO-SS28 TaxID=3447455 RepID=UPI003EDEB65C
MPLAERLRTARKMLNLSSTDMAAQLSVSRRTWESYERGESDPKASILEWLIENGFSPDWLLLGKGPRRRSKEDAGCQLEIDAVQDDWVTFPLHTARAAAGSGAVNEPGFPSPGLAFDPALAAHLLNTSPRSLAGLYVAGDSMEPTFGDGDVLIINTSIERITGDAIYVLVVDEGCIVKRITCLTDGRLVLRSDNPTYADETIDPARKSHLKIYGRVVAAVKRL